MNNLKRYKEIMGKEFEGNDYSTEKFQDSKAVFNLIKEIERKSKMLINRDKELLALNEEIERLKQELEKLNAELRRYKSIVWLCEKVKDCDKE